MQLSGNRTMKRERGISVIISGMPSVGKTTAAIKVAEKFKLRHLAGGDMLKEIAKDRGFALSGTDWWDTPEGMRFMAERKKDLEFDKEVDRRLINHLKHSSVVMTSYPLPWIVKEPALKLWFKASQKTRAKRLAGRDAISSGSAMSIVRKRDLDNRKLYRRLYGINFGKDLSPFNFILDTEKLNVEEVANATCKLVSEYSKSKKIA